ncbi:MAG: glycine betaine ABC transporter substrate-binding protein [Actinomycetota bacterium]|nr:glycine betaine ABC transporter substrate-binding protein [Actinomycetota bacterium]
MRRTSSSLAFLLILVDILAGGCGGGSSLENSRITLGDISWDESVAVANLTKVLLEEEVGYEEVELQTLDVALLFEGVGTGELGAFQDVWLPNHQEYLNEQGDNVVQVGEWYQGQTSFGIAVPSYMDINSLEELNDSDASEIFGIEPGAVIMEKIPDSVIPAYDLEQELVESSTPGMLSEIENLYENQEEFAFVAWSPHWMNQRYDYKYLEDPLDALEELDEPSQLSTIVNEDFPEDQPVAYAFVQALTLDEEQLNDLEATINEVGEPLEGARQWAAENPDVVEPWVDAARNAEP